MTGSGKCAGAATAVGADGCLRLEPMGEEVSMRARAELSALMRDNAITPKALAWLELQMVAGKEGQAPLSTDWNLGGRGFAQLRREDLGLARVPRAKAVVERYFLKCGAGEG